jgi:hypothetical protein
MTTRLDSLNALEEAAAEEAAGQPLTVLDDDNAPKVRIICALAWVHKRREQPELTFQEYLKTHRFRDALPYIFDDVEADQADGAEAAEVAPVADPFPAGAHAAAPAGPADAEGAVLSGDGAVAG